jgi:hypothetical protein
MFKPFIYKILFFANIIIAILLILFIFLAELTGMRLVLASMMALTGIAGAVSMYSINKRPKK